MHPYVEPSLTDLWQMLCMLSIPATVMLTARFLNRFLDRRGDHRVRPLAERRRTVTPR